MIGEAPIGGSGTFVVALPDGNTTRIPVEVGTEDLDVGTLEVRR